MTSEYCQSVIDELNANCENKHLPPSKTGIRSKREPKPLRDVWTLYDIYSDVCDGKLRWKNYCRIDPGIVDDDGQNFTYTLCSSCKEIIDNRLAKVFIRSENQK